MIFLTLVPILRHQKPIMQALRITDEQVNRLEAEIDEMNASLAPLSSFILPGGSAASAWLHLAAP